MKFTGFIDDAHLSMKGELLITMRIKEKAQAVKFLDEIVKDKLLSIDISYFRQKRSLNANAYFHTICQKLADAKCISMTEQKNLLIQEYGQFDMDENGNIPRLLIDDSVEYLKIPWAHLYPTQDVQWSADRLYRAYLVRRGSHTYNSKEMSDLIAGLIVDAKEHDIEVLTPDEIKRMVNAWKGAGDDAGRKSS